MNTSTIIIIVIFSTCGFAYFRYGKKQSRLIPMICGAALMGIPYLISNLWLLAGTGLVLVLVPFFVKG